MHAYTHTHENHAKCSHISFSTESAPKCCTYMNVKARLNVAHVSFSTVNEYESTYIIFNSE